MATPFRLMKTAAKHPEIYPLVGIVGFAAAFGTFCLTRSALVYPDLVWDHKTNPNPWMEIKQDKQTKAYASHDYSQRKGLEPPKY